MQFFTFSEGLRHLVKGEHEAEATATIVKPSSDWAPVNSARATQGALPQGRSKIHSLLAAATIIKPF